LPFGLNLQELLINNPIENDPYPNEPTKNLDRIAFIVNILCRSHLRTKTGQNRGITARRKSLCTIVLQSITREYQIYRKWLEDVRIMKQVAPGIKGVACGKFVFYNDYQVKDFTFHLIVDEKFLNTIYRQSRPKD